MRPPIVVALIGLAWLLAMPAFGATERDMDDCNQDADQDRSIEGCSRVIGDRKESLRSRAVAHYNRGLAWRAKGDLDRAMVDYNEAIRLDSRYARAFGDRGNIWLIRNDLDRALADYDEAIRLDPKFAAAHYNRGNARLVRNEHDLAIADYTEAIRIDPRFARAFNNRCLARATAPRDLQEALADCAEAVRLRPDDANALDNRGFVYLRLGRFDEALADFNAALRLDSRNPHALYGRGIAKLRRGDAASGNADLVVARGAKPGIAEEFARHGITPSAVATPASSGTPQARPASQAANCGGAEAHWRGADSAGTMAAYLDHIARFPNCPFAMLARLRIEALQR